MSGNKHLKAWVSRETKERFTEFARGQGVSESALLKRIIEGLIGANTVPNTTCFSCLASGRDSDGGEVTDLSKWDRVWLTCAIGFEGGLHADVGDVRRG